MANQLGTLYPYAEACKADLCVICDATKEALDAYNAMEACDRQCDAETDDQKYWDCIDDAAYKEPCESLKNACYQQGA